MNLDERTVNIKPLTAYQAIDLGMAVGRAYYGDLWRLWVRACISHQFCALVVTYLISLTFSLTSKLPLITLLMVNIFIFSFAFKTLETSFTKLLLPSFVFIFIVYCYGQFILSGYYYLSSDSLFWSLFILMAFYKASFDSVLLTYLSQKLFDKDITIDDITDMPTLGLDYRLGRFSLQRMMSMSVYLLERQSGKALKHRIKTLTRNQSGATHLHGLFFLVSEIVATWGGVMMIDYLMSIYGDGLSSDTHYLWATVLYVIFLSLLSPFYVASGFVMYLCKRSLLEGWDIELTFRQLAHRHRTALTPNVDLTDDKEVYDE